MNGGEGGKFLFYQCVFLQVNFTEIGQSSKVADMETEIWEILVLI